MFLRMIFCNPRPGGRRRQFLVQKLIFFYFQTCQRAPEPLHPGPLLRSDLPGLPGAEALLFPSAQPAHCWPPPPSRPDILQ